MIIIVPHYNVCLQILMSKRCCGIRCVLLLITANIVCIFWTRREGVPVQARFKPTCSATESYRGGSWISGKGVQMYKGVAVRLADFKYHMKIHFHRIFKSGGEEGPGSSEPHEPPLDPPLSQLDS